MASFSSLLGVSLTNPVAILSLVGMILPQEGTPKAYKPAKLWKPEKGAKDPRWLVIWWQYSPAHGKVVRRRQGFDLASIPLKADREVRAGEWCTALNTLLKDGYLHGEPSELPVPAEPTPVDLSWSSLEVGFLASRAHESKPVRDYYANTCRVFRGWCTGQGIPTPQDLSPSHTKSFLTFLSTTLSPRTGKPLQVTTQNRLKVGAKVLGEWGREHGYFTEGQGKFFGFQKTKAPKSTRHKPYTQVQLQAILRESKDNPQLHLFLHLAYYTFCRPGKELTRMKVEDLQPTTIWIPPHHDKNRVGRFVTIPQPLETVLREYGIRDFPPHYYLFTKKGVPGTKPVEESYFYKNLKRVLTKLGLDGQDYTLYSLKATGNIALWKHTQDLDLIRRQNGHSSLAQTEVYLRQLGVLDNSKALSSFPVMGGT